MGRKPASLWTPVPRDRAPEWFTLPFESRALGLELYFASRGDPIPVADDWRVSLCRTLCIEAHERAGAAQGFNAMLKRGLIEIRDGFCRVHWQRIPAPPPGHSEVSPESLPGLSQVSSGSLHAEVSVNTQVTGTQIDREIDKRERENARAREAEIELEEVRRRNAANRQRPPPPEPPPELPPPEREPSTEVWAAFETLAGPQGHPHLHREALSSLGAVCAARAELGKSTVRAVADALIAAWLADPWVAKNKPAIANLAKNPGRYLQPLAAPKPAVVKVKPPPLHPRMQKLKDEFNAAMDAAMRDKTVMIDDIQKLQEEFEEKRELIEYELRQERQHAAAP